MDVEGIVLREAEYTQKLHSTTTNFYGEYLSGSPNIYGENLSAYKILSPLGGDYPENALGTQYIEIFDNQTGETVHNIYLEFLDGQARQSAKYLFLENAL